jgi:uncharacterized protein
MDTYALPILLLICVFAMGFLVPRGTTCAVAAVSEALERGSVWRFAGFAVASATTIVTLIPLSWLLILPLNFAPTIEVTGLIGLGGFLFGVGAAINGACVFGTLTKIVSGDVSYLFVLIGLWAGAIVLGVSGLSLAPSLNETNTSAQFSTFSGSMVALAGLYLLIAFVVFITNKRLSKAAIMAAIGLSGGLLYTLHPFWNYTTVVQDYAHAIIMVPRHMSDGLLPWLVMVACLGGLVSTVLAGTFKLKKPNLGASLGSVAGGFLMAFGIVMIPGGNDGLILFLLPSLVPAGLLAYLTMNIGIALVLSIERSRAKMPRLSAQ